MVAKFWKLYYNSIRKKNLPLNNFFYKPLINYLYSPRKTSSSPTGLSLSSTPPAYLPQGAHLKRGKPQLKVVCYHFSAGAHSTNCLVMSE